MSGPKRTADKLNTIGIVVVGICSAVLVYVTIVALQAFYMGDTSEIQMMADYGGQDTQAKHIRATQTENLTKPSSPNSAPTGAAPQTYRIPITVAMKKVADEAKADPANLIPIHGRSECRTVMPVFGRPRTDEKPPCAPPTPAPTTPTAPTTPAAPTMTPTGGTGPGGGPLPNQGSGTTGQGAGSAEKGNGR